LCVLTDREVPHKFINVPVVLIFLSSSDQVDKLNQCLQFRQALSKKELFSLLAQCVHLAQITRTRAAIYQIAREARASRACLVTRFALAMEFT
jgi:hypothetical protein